ncbi:hypothetical protein [Streptomyces sp. NBC_00091]|uniref:hypothetical protein n=1 Tax=Streptomyces sp. NBC_00091 TaxID=2975648 RepID=UPI00224F31CB|nr:hypothetical protein [Streptomyces sp. NBC_00091]MCX5379565.1 hypothetical protein [Streptomyces sp. NBC_00091]
MVLASPARAYAPYRLVLSRRVLGRVRQWDRAPGAEVVGAWQLLTVWALLLVTGAVPAGAPVELGVSAVALAAAGYLHGLLLVKPLAALGRWTARLSAWPGPVAVGVLVAAGSVPAAVVVRWWLEAGVPGGVPGAGVPGLGPVWAGCAASVVLPLVVGAVLRARAVRVPVGALWVRCAGVAGAAVGVVALAAVVVELPV